MIDWAYSNTRIAATALAALLALGATADGAIADTKIRIARPMNPDIVIVPAIIARQRGLFRAEGLDATLVPMTAKTMVTAGIRGAVDFVPDSAGGARAALKGAQLRYVVGGATISRWAIAAAPKIRAPEDLRGRNLAQSHAGDPGFGEGARVLREIFGLRQGRHYKGMSFPSDLKRLAALTEGTVQAALLSFPYAAKARHAGFGILLRPGAYRPRLDGAYWTSRGTLEKKRAAAAGFIRAIARAMEYLRADAEGSAEIIRRAFDIRDRREARFLRDMIHDGFGPDIPDAPFREMFESRRQDLISRGLWSRTKKLPDVERFVARGLLTAALRGMGYRLAQSPDLTRSPD